MYTTPSSRRPEFVYCVGADTKVSHTQPTRRGYGEPVRASYEPRYPCESTQFIWLTGTPARWINLRPAQTQANNRRKRDTSGDALRHVRMKQRKRRERRLYNSHSCGRCARAGRGLRPSRQTTHRAEQHARSTRRASTQMNHRSFGFGVRGGIK